MRDKAQQEGRATVPEVVHLLAASLAGQSFEPTDLTGVPGPVFALIQRSSEAALAFLAARGMPRDESYRLVRWILCGMLTGPDPADLWNWHHDAGTLRSQVSGCMAAAGRIPGALPGTAVAGQGS